jgi:hypothetical protein
MQNGPQYPSVEIEFLHSTLDLAVLNVANPACEIPLCPSDQRIGTDHNLRYWGYAPSISDFVNHIYQVAVVNIPKYESEEPRERHDGTEWVLKFESRGAVLQR